jgi:ABC-type glutathione transport system ATPase component
MKKLLIVNNMNVSYNNNQDLIVEGISFELKKGEVLGITGPSGAGKSVMARSLMGLDFICQSSITGQVTFKDKFNLPEDSDKLNGREIAMIFQDPAATLHPDVSLYHQLEEVYRLNHNEFNTLELKRILGNDGVNLLELLNIKNDDDIIEILKNKFPYELSGGTCQRFMIGMTLAADPSLVIADEPVTDLDGINKKEIIDLLVKFKEKNKSIIIISHDISIFERHGFVDSLLYVEKKNRLLPGKIVESFSSNDNDWCFSKASPKIKKIAGDWKKIRESSIGPGTGIIQRVESLLEVQNVTKTLKNILKNKNIFTLNIPKLRLKKGVNVGIIGENASGKSTTAKLLTGLIWPDDPKNGSHWIKYNLKGDKPNSLKNILLNNKQKSMFRGSVQYIFQDSGTAMNMSVSVERSLRRLLDLKRDDQNMNLYKKLRNFIPCLQDREGYKKKYSNLLDELGLKNCDIGKKPFEFSEGQKRRLFLAMNFLAFYGNCHKILIIDEAFRGLDIDRVNNSIEFLRKKQKEQDITYITISHDMNIIKNLSHYIYVLKEGKIIEAGFAEEILHNPNHAYSKKLIAAMTKNNSRRF